MLPRALPILDISSVGLETTMTSRSSASDYTGEKECD